MEAKKQQLQALCVPILDDVIAETDELFDTYERNVDGIDRNGIPTTNGEAPDFLSFYQTEGVIFAFDRKRAIIADQMGVGKTPQGVALRYEIENRTGKSCRTLVICPNSVKEYWADCITAWSKRERTGKVVFLEKYDAAALRDAEGADWVILNYDLLAVQAESEQLHPGVTTRKRIYRWLNQQEFRLVILDEVQNAKNNARPLSQNVVEIARKSEYLLLLSGTPVPNWLHDIFVIMTLLEPEVFPDTKVVRLAYTQDPRVIRAFFKRRRLQRTLEDVVRLPKMSTKRVWLDLPEAQRAAYNAVREYYALSGGVKLLRLKQALLDPQLLPDEVASGELKKLGSEEPVKYRELDRILKREIRAGNKVLVFSPLARQHVIERLAERYRHYGVITQDGSVSENRRREMRKRFQKDPTVRVCLATDVVGEGVNLTAASVVVFLDLPYAPGEYDQMVARVHRRGQTKQVRVYELLVRGTVDEGTVEFVDTKRQAIRFLESGYRLTSEQLEAMTKRVYQTDSHRRRMWTGQEYINWYAARMSGTGYSKNRKALERNDGEIARHYAECYTDSWERTVSANSAEVCRRIVRGLEGRVSLGEKLDLGGAFGVLSHVLRERMVVTDINPHHHETDFYREHIAQFRNEVVIAPYHDLPREWLRRFDLAVCALGLHQAEREERRQAIREAWRVLRPGGYYLITLPMGTVGEYGDRFLKAVESGGWDVVSELSGIVHSTEPAEVGFQIMVILAVKGLKAVNIDPEAMMLDCDDLIIRGTEPRCRLHTQQRAGKVTRFAFNDGEPLEARIVQYTRRI